MRLYVVALSGEAAPLAATLRSLRDTAAVYTGGRDADTRGAFDLQVLGSDDPALRHCAEQAGCGLTAALPETIASDHYWSTLLRLLPTIEGHGVNGPSFDGHGFDGHSFAGHGFDGHGFDGHGSESHNPEDHGAAGYDGYSLILRAGCQLPPYWLPRLCTAARRSAAGAVFPLSVRDPLTSVFSSHRHQPGLGVEDVDRWLNRYSSHTDIDIPLFAGYCGLFAGPWPAPAGDDSQLAAEWRNRGVPIIASDALYIDDSALAPVALPASLYPGWREALIERHPFTALRHALTELSSRAETPPLEVPPVRPVRLHVSHSWGGGLGRWVEDFITADTAHHNLVLRPIGHWDAFAQTLALYPGPQMDVPLKTWTLAQPILSTALAHHQYREILREIVDTYGVGSLLVSSLIGHSLDVLHSGLPTTFVCHDFYPVCPPLYATWGSPCESCDSSRLANCLSDNPLHRIFRIEPHDHWVALRRAFADVVATRDITLVAPCQSVARRLQTLLPPLVDRTIAVIGHGLSPESIAELAVARRCEPEDVPEDEPRDDEWDENKRLRIVILGSLADHKGAALLAPVLAQIGEFADLLLLGAGDDGRRFASAKGVTWVESYQRHQLGGLLAEFKPSLGLLLSTVPETFSYTLSELQAAGVPVAATALGAFADRIQHQGDGWLFEPTPTALLALLHQLHGAPNSIATVRTQLLAQPVKSAAAMVADYDRLESPSARVRGHIERPRAEQQRPADRDYLAEGQLYINPQASYRQVLRDFIRFTAKRIQHSQRLPSPLRRTVAAFVRRWLR